jgi:transposase
MKLDADCYEVFEKKERQYIKVMSLQKGERIAIPLLGKTPISGNIILLLKGDQVEVHLTQEILSRLPLQNGPIASVDFGYTEVMVDRENNHYGTQLGPILTKSSDELSENIKKRNKLRDLSKKSKKAKNIKKFNLGKEKFYKKKNKVEASISQEINQAIHKLVDTAKPSVLVTEDLSHLFTYDKPKNVNRRLSSWVRGEIQDRVSFKALVKSFHHEQVNPTYGSQTCPLCDFVDKGNRKRDVFRCLHCKHEDVADRVAAENYGKRYGDPEIRLGMLPSKVKPILLTRFHRRLEEEQSSTVPGRTAETVSDERPPLLSKETIAGRARARKHRTVPRRAKQKQDAHIRAYL